MAIEDAAVLGDLFSRVSSLKQVPALLQAYQDLRYAPPPRPIVLFLIPGTFVTRLPRATVSQEASRLNQKIFHLPDGPEQRARDKAMRAAMAAELEGKPILAQ